MPAGTLTARGGGAAPATITIAVSGLALAFTTLKQKLGDASNALNTSALGGPRANKALAYVEKVDRERQEWTRFLFGVDWNDSQLYEAVLNLSRLNLECEGYDSQSGIETTTAGGWRYGFAAASLRLALP